MDACTVCLFPQDTSTEPAYLNCCDHYFHYDCVLKWCQVSSTCPLCVRTIQTIYYHRIPYSIQYKSQEDVGSGAVASRPVLLSPEEQRRQDVIRKQNRIMNDSNENKRKREAEESIARARAREELMALCWEDYRRFSERSDGGGSSETDSGNRKKSSRRSDSAPTSSFVRGLLAEEQAAREARAKAVPKRLRRAVDRPPAMHALVLKLQELLCIPSDDPNACGADAVLSAASRLAYSSDLAHVRRLLQQGLLDVLVQIISVDAATTSQKETCLRLLHSLPVTREALGAVSVDYTRALNAFAEAADGGAGDEGARDTLRLAGVAAKIAREWTWQT